ncbi:MAG: acetylornithine deacetylase [Alphaproteobacteria bacterium]|nr:acetylornithine deacetylase [Alphaproteobacteria bacterium]
MTGARSADLLSLDMIRRLIEMPTVSRDSNLALIEHVRGYLQGLGIDSTLFFSDDRKKASLYATIGPLDTPGIMLAGHTDVVPVDGQEWTVDPWQLTGRDGKLFGRGVCDMKGFVAVALAFAPVFQRRQPKIPIHYAFTFDEEVSRVGITKIVDGLADFPVHPAMCIVGEPSDMKVVVSHKGKKSLRCRVRGFEAHSSLAPQGVNAIEYACALIAHINQRQQEFALRGPRDEEFDVPYTTFNVGVMQGGTALNIVAKDCVFQFEFRHLPQVDPERLYAEVQAYAKEVLEPRMHAVHADTGFTFEEMSAFPALDTRPDADVVRVAKALARQNEHGKVAFGTEASVISTRGRIPSIVCGPGHIDQAHKPDEFTTIEQFKLCEEFMHRLADHVAGDGPRT